jgi:hypothetical protein
VLPDADLFPAPGKVEAGNNSPLGTGSASKVGQLFSRIGSNQMIYFLTCFDFVKKYLK